ncbi:leucine-rich repeats and immunoglobulin-like domains protein 3 [Watersipora subatra]|uniref:leucine-rich repeats and immunoglobulin-like domains protein 3 n=1 Tax=Watersipora subatra TaxID=2589382 RepID=UPI00355B965A
MIAFIFLLLPAVILALQDTTCPEHWPTPETRFGRESCSCETVRGTGLRIKCSWLATWPVSTSSNTQELLLDGTRANTTIQSYRLGQFAPDLRVYSCCDCGITSIEQLAFLGLHHIKTIRLRENSIRTIKKHAFLGLKNLDELSLERSEIFTIESQAFYGLFNVGVFDLTGNTLYDIQINAFENVTLINQLVFNQIKTERLKSYSLKGLKHIGLISFTHSEIRKLEEYSFFGVENITTINFHSSKLRDILPYAFVGLGKVGSIKMKSTSISTLTCEALEGLDCVKSVDWTLSPFRCDCNIQWMIELTANISLDIIKGMKCASPYQFRNRNPFELERNELGCLDEERFMGCARLDTRYPRVKALERYIDEIRRPNSSATYDTFSFGLLFLTALLYFIH